MTTTQTASPKQKNSRSHKKQKSVTYVSIGAPARPVRQQTKKHEPELLSDWDHAS
ncbi:MAG: hypothetical protein VKL59_09675 [Nostocaceae cyanobacterium]|nr:hypothetical protein [Nostocaceae cyanobacterium]